MWVSLATHTRVSFVTVPTCGWTSKARTPRVSASTWCSVPLGRSRRKPRARLVATAETAAAPDAHAAPLPGTVQDSEFERAEACSVVEVFHDRAVHIGVLRTTPAEAACATSFRVHLVSADNQEVSVAPDQVIANWSETLVPPSLFEELSTAGEQPEAWLPPVRFSQTRLQHAWDTARLWLQPHSTESWLALQSADRLGILALLSEGLYELHQEVSCRGARRGGPFTSAVELAARYQLRLRERFRRRLWPADETTSPVAKSLCDPFVLRILAAMTLGSDNFRFRRVPRYGGGWRALPEPMVRARIVESFCERVHATRQSLDRTWHPEHLAVLRELEMLAASRSEHRRNLEPSLRTKRQGMSAPSTRLGRLYPLAAAVCRRVASEVSPNTAISVLVKLGQWTLSETSKESASTPPATLKRRPNVCPEPKIGQKIIAAFPDAVMTAARALRSRILSGRTRNQRSVWSHQFAFCVDSSSARILDDAFSVEIEQRCDPSSGASGHRPGDLQVTWHVHIVDIGRWLPAGHPVDQIACQRAQSLYLPGRPLHLLPPPLANAASFSEHLATDAITVSLRFRERSNDQHTGSDDLGAIEWFTVRRSVIPPVQRISYEELDRLILSNRRVRALSVSSSSAAAAAAAGVSSTTTTSSLSASSPTDTSTETLLQRASNPLTILQKALNSAALEQRMRARMHARQRRNAGRIARVAHRRDGSLAVAEFALSPGYCLVDALLAAASEALIRFAAQHKIPVPVTRWTRVQNTELGTLAAQKVTASEPNAVQAYRPQRFGTAPLRRYLDLMTLRQISLYLEYGAEAPLLTRAQVARIAAQVQRNASAGMQKVVASRQSLMLDVLAERQSQVQRLGPGELVLNGLVASVSSNGRTALIILEDDQMEATVTLERSQRLRIGERRAFRLVRLDRTQCGARAIQLALVVDSVSV
jgi:hypothetical protein